MQLRLPDDQVSNCQPTLPYRTDFLRAHTAKDDD
jgi:hypothetical protein